VAPKRYFRTVDIFAILFTVCTLIASWVIFERPYGTMGTIAASIGPFIASFVALGVIFAGAAFARKPVRPSNHPRIVHLRIAGKYQASGRFGETGVSPLDLRG